MADYARLLNLIERYDRTIAQLEDSVIAEIERNLDASFRTLEQEFRRAYARYLEGGTLTATIQTAALMEELGTFLEIIRPEMAAEYEQLFRDAMSLASGLGDSMGVATVAEIDPGFDLGTFQGVPVEVIAAQARDATERLYRYNDEMRSAISGIVQVGFGSGWGANRVAQQLRIELGVTKTKAETLARTEMMSAVNTAAEARYNAAGLFVQVLNSPSEGLCGLCAARNGNVYRVGQVRVPFHPRCRCTIVPFSPGWLKDGLVDTEWLKDYRSKGLEQAKANGFIPDYRASYWERKAGAEQAPEPVWRPT